MSEKREQRIESIFQGALELDDSKARASYVRNAAAGDEALIAEVERLLAADALDENLATGAALGEVETETFGEGIGEALGSMIGPYKLLQQIGEGGFGVVYMAEQEKPVRRRVALKIIKSGMDTKQVIARFEAERQALAMMDHSNIARVFDGGPTDNGRPYFVMELVRGMPITDYCDEQKLATEDRLKLFMDVCAAVQHAHQKGIIHRDLKPSNVLITVNDGRPVPKVIDFGIAKATEQKLTDKTLFTRMEQAIGTPDYMSPEQAGMSSLDVDTRSDVYSLGVMLYVLLTGEKPFDWGGTSWDEIKRRLKEEEPQKPSTKVGTMGVNQLTEAAHRRRSEPGQLGTQLKGDLDWIVLKAMEKDRERRYETANALRLDIQRFLDGALVSAVAPSLSYRWSKFVRRNRKVVVAGSAVAAMLLVATVINAISAGQAISKSRETERALEQLASKEQETREALHVSERAKAEVEAQAITLREQAVALQASRNEAIRNQYAADINLANQMLREDNLGRARELLERHMPRNEGDEDNRGWEWRYLRQQCFGDERETLIQSPGLILHLDVSADERWLAIMEQGRDTYSLWDREGKEPTIDLVGPQAYFGNCHLVFSPVDPLLAYTILKNDRVWYSVYDVNERKIIASAELGRLGLSLSRSNYGQLMFSEDGARLLATGDADGDRAMEDSEISVWNARNGRMLFRRTVPRMANHGVLGYGLLADGDLERIIYESDRNPERELICLQLSTNKVLWRDSIGQRNSYSYCSSPDGTRFAIGGGSRSDFNVKICRWEDGKVLKTLAGHRAWVGQLRFLDDNTLISSSADQTIRIWDVALGATRRVLRGHQWEVQDFELLRESRQIISASKDGMVKVWELDPEHSVGGRMELPVGTTGSTFWFSADSESLYVFERLEQRVLQFSGDQFESRVELLSGLGDYPGVFYEVEGRDLFVIGSSTGRIQARELPSGSLAFAFDVGPGPVEPNRTIVRGQEMASFWFPEEDVTRLWRIGGEPPNGEMELAGFRNIQTSSTQWARSDWLVSGGSQFNPFNWMLILRNDPDMAFNLPQFTTSYGRNWAPDGKHLLSAQEPGVIEKLYCDAETRSVRLVGTFSGSLSGFRGPNVTRDQRRLFATSGNHEYLNVWDFETTQKLLTLEGKAFGRWDAYLSPDETMFASLNQLDSILIWRAPSFEDLEAMERRAEERGRPRLTR